MVPHLSRSLLSVLAATLLACVLAIVPAVAATLVGKVDHALMGLGETFDYTLSLTGGDGRQPPDVSALSRDFDIVERRRGSRSDTVDGKPVSVDEWVMTLAPKRTGLLTVPALTVSGAASQPLQVEVVPSVPGPPLEDLNLQVRTDVAKVDAYAQSEIPVVVRVYDAVGITQGRLDRLAADGAVVTPVASQRVYFKTVGGKRYRVIEQSYLLQPQTSGPVTIDPVTLEASLPGKRGSSAASDMANLLGRGVFPNSWPDENVTLRSRPVTLQVKPRPSGAQGWFLPARGATLTSTWSPPLSAARVGTALTRTIRLEARGAAPNQLPPLPVAEVEGLRQYDDAATPEHAQIKGESGAVLEQHISMVPTRPGTYTLPKVEVGWWNVATGRQERAVLPAETFVVPADRGAPAPIAAPVAAAPAAPAAPEPPAAPSLLAAVWDRLGRAALVAAGVAVVLLLAFGLWLRAILRGRARAKAAAEAAAALPAWRPPVREEAAPVPRLLSGAEAERALLAACTRNDAAAAHRALLAWVSAQGARPGGFATARMAEAAEELREALYGGIAGRWKGRALKAAFAAERRARRRARKARRGSRLAPLYPEAG